MLKMNQKFKNEGLSRFEIPKSTFLDEKIRNLGAISEN